MDEHPAPLWEQEPYAGFDLQVTVDQVVYAAGQTVRLTVSAANQVDRFVEHRYPGWHRYELTIHDEHHRVVADDVVDRTADSDAVDRWLPGQLVLWPTYWTQTAGPIVPAHVPGAVPGLQVPRGRYRARVAWLGREPGVRQRPPDGWSRWFELA